ncbi:hypothetical protein ACS0TY_001132 [Phlomoides rotata]
MASIGIQSAKIVHQSFLPTSKSNHMFSPKSILSVSNAKKNPQQIVSASLSSSHQGIVAPNRGSSAVDSDADFHGVIDSMMHESVADIVKNLKRAPLLVQIYSENDGIKVHTERAVPENWPLVKKNWRSEGSKSPDVLIFVEELGPENEKLRQKDSEDGVTRAWGVIVQGKGVECGPACYLLKTNRVCAGFGLGFCTHFCFMRVNNFRDSAWEQFKEFWLVK